MFLNLPLYLFLTIKRLGGYFVKESPKKFWWAFKGFSKGVMQAMKILKKRKDLKKLQKVSFYEIKFTPE